MVVFRRFKRTYITFVFGPFVKKIKGKQKIIGKSFCYAYNNMAVTHGSSNISFIIECSTDVHRALTNI